MGDIVRRAGLCAGKLTELFEDDHSARCGGNTASVDEMDIVPEDILCPGAVPGPVNYITENGQTGTGIVGEVKLRIGIETEVIEITDIHVTIVGPTAVGVEHFPESGSRREIQRTVCCVQQFDEVHSSISRPHRSADGPVVGHIEKDVTQLIEVYVAVVDKITIQGASVVTGTAGCNAPVSSETGEVDGPLVMPFSRDCISPDIEDIKR